MIEAHQDWEKMKIDSQRTSFNTHLTEFKES